MFLNTVLARNPQLIDAAVKLHQEGKIPSNAYVLDLDMIVENTKYMIEKAMKMV